MVDKYIDIIKAFCDGYGEGYGVAYVSNYKDDMYVYGDGCIGIRCRHPLPTLVQLCDTIRDAGLDDCSPLECVQQDNMETDYILYFPDIEEEGCEDDSEGVC